MGSVLTNNAQGSSPAHPVRVRCPRVLGGRGKASGSWEPRSPNPLDLGKARRAPHPRATNEWEVVTTEATLTRAFAWLAEHDVTPDDPVLYAQMVEEWADKRAEYGLSEGAFKRSVLAIFDVLHPMVTDVPPLIEGTGAHIGAQAVYATLIRGVFGVEFYAWAHPDSQGNADSQGNGDNRG